MNNRVTLLHYRIARIYRMDLEPILYKLVHNDNGESLSVEAADSAALKYRQFLELCLRYPNTVIVPTKEIDKVWHAHILDTGKYRKDCDEVFGYFLDHFPYLGLRGKQDAANLVSLFTVTSALFHEHFGYSLSGAPEICGSTRSNIQSLNIYPSSGAVLGVRPRLARMAA